LLRNKISQAVLVTASGLLGWLLYTILQAQTTRPLSFLSENGLVLWSGGIVFISDVWLAQVKE
jgi:hypothetical protein